MSAIVIPQRSSLAIIFGIVFLDLIGFGIVIPVLPLYAERFGASPWVIGLLLGIYSAMQCLCAPWLGRLSDRIGRRPVLLLSVAGTAVGFLLMGIADSLTWLFVARIIDGATGGNISTAMAYIADTTPPEHRSRGMGLIGAAFGLGFIVGPALGGLFSQVSPAAPFFVAASLAAANVVAIYFCLPESVPAHPAAPMRGLWQGIAGRALGFTVATYFLTTVAFSLLTTTYPLFTNRRFGYGPVENGYLFAGFGVLSAIVQGGLLGWLVKRSGDKTLAVVGAALLAVNLAILPMSGTLLALLVMTGGIAVGHGLVAATLNGLASRHAGAAVQGQVLGLMQSAASFARVVGPVLGGWLLQLDAVQWSSHFGRTPYWAAAAVMVVAVALALAL